MSQASARQLSKDEIVALQQVLAFQRGNARNLLGIITTFAVPILGTMAFVAFYPPFWRPALAASAAAIAAGVIMLYLLWAYRIYQPVRRLQADLQAGEAATCEGEVRSCDTSQYLVALTLAEKPSTVFKLFPPLTGQDERRNLTVGQRIYLELLPNSGRLVTVRRAG